MNFNSLSKVGLVAALLALSGVASAQTNASKGISVTATLTSKCQVATASAGAITLPFGTYLAFGPAVNATQQSITFECTRGLTATPAFAWDTLAGTAAGVGTIAGLRYELTAANGTVSAGTAPDTAVANDIGTPRSYPVTVDGVLLSGQAGTDSSGVQSVTRTLTVTF